MTTRKEQLLKQMGYNNLNYLQTLSHDDALSLFAQHAVGANNFDSHPILRPHGEDIMKKCDGLPLALEVLGRLLRTKTEEEEWKEMLNSEIWRLGEKDEIIPALRLSYHDLSACLKQLFAYCSLFPKDYMFDKDDLILLWMAEGYLNQPSTSKSMERLGLEYFEELLSRSLFQHTPNDKLFFMMHDLLNDIAISVAGEFFVRLDKGMVADIRKESLERYHHMSFVCEEDVAYSKFKALERAKSLRTFLAVSIVQKDRWEVFYLSSKILVDLFPKLPLLSLSGSFISEVPQTIGSLKHLRYLNLSETLIKNLPENVSNLYNLQTLILFGCHRLCKLPNNFSMLKNLRHLDIRDTPQLNKMPLGIGRLKTLQTLSKIIIGGHNGLAIAELKDLTHLHGKTHVKGLEKVEMAMHANLLQKRFSELELEWSDVFDDSRNESLEREVLSALKPHNYSLIKLGIVSYGGTEFPNWVGDPLFLHLISVSIRGCKKCTSLPTFGQLPSLKELFIEDMDEVKSMGSELTGTGLAFPSLKILKLQNMKRLVTWSTDIGTVSFPRLEKLVIRNCPELGEVSIEELPSLKDLEIKECDSGVLRRLVQAAPSVKILSIRSISGLNDVVWNRVMEYLGDVGELIIRECNEIRNFEVRKCQKLVRLGEEEDNRGSNLLTTLRILRCQNIQHCRCPNSIEGLEISFCPSITSISFPRTKGHKLKYLVIYDCDKLLENDQLEGDNSTRVFMINNKCMPMLQFAALWNWRGLTTIIELSHFIHLTSVEIVNCENLESFPDHELPNLTLLRELIICNCPRINASFPRGFWPPKMHTLKIGGLKKPILDRGPQNFPTSLVDIGLLGGESDDVRRCSQLSYLIPSSLTCLQIHGFKKLKSVSMGLQHVTSLQHLSLEYCPKMKNLPDILLFTFEFKNQGMPTSRI